MDELQIKRKTLTWISRWSLVRKRRERCFNTLDVQWGHFTFLSYKYLLCLSFTSLSIWWTKSSGYFLFWSMETVFILVCFLVVFSILSHYQTINSCITLTHRCIYYLHYCHHILFSWQSVGRFFWASRPKLLRCRPLMSFHQEDKPTTQGAGREGKDVTEHCPLLPLWLMFKCLYRAVLSLHQCWPNNMQVAVLFCIFSSLQSIHSLHTTGLAFCLSPTWSLSSPTTYPIPLSFTPSFAPLPSLIPHLPRTSTPAVTFRPWYMHSIIMLLCHHSLQTVEGLLLSVTPLLTEFMVIPSLSLPSLSHSLYLFLMSPHPI